MLLYFYAPWRVSQICLGSSHRRFRCRRVRLDLLLLLVQLALNVLVHLVGSLEGSSTEH